MNGDLDNQVDEHLEAIWLCHEEGLEGDVEAVLARTEGGGRREVLEVMEKRGLLHLGGDRFELTEEGLKASESLVRRHRLAERLLTDVLGVVGRDMNEAACRFEHCLSSGVTESICTLLGHPPRCPHGLPIPPGPCCLQRRTDLRPLVVRLDRCPVGERGKVSMISCRSPDRLRRLGTLGLLPGADIRLEQKRPAYVLEVGETAIALEGELATEIYVKRTE